MYSAGALEITFTDYNKYFEHFKKVYERERPKKKNVDVKL
jgi:hypothetical protein